jgi:putative membrane protein
LTVSIATENPYPQTILMHSTKVKIPDDKRASEFLANERTFLAWIRTSVAIISLGFVVAKFDVWLRELAVRLAPQIPLHTTGLSLPIGITLMSLGGILAALAAVHYHYINLAIERNEVKANRMLVIIVTAGVVFVAIMMIIYLMKTVNLAGLQG